MSVNTIVKTFSKEEQRIRQEFKQSTRLQGIFKYDRLVELKKECKDCITDVDYFLENNITENQDDLLDLIIIKNVIKMLKEDISKSKSKFMDKLLRTDGDLWSMIEERDEVRKLEEFYKNYERRD